MFWDTVDEFQVRAEAVGQRVEDALAQKDVKLNADVSFEEFASLLDEHAVSVEWDGWSKTDVHRAVSQIECTLLY